MNNAGATGNVVQGNYIGTDITGTIALGNVRHGVSITHDNNSTIPSASNNTVGGTAAGAGNLISGNGSFGVVIFGPNGGASGNFVQGNLIGTDVTGLHALGNTGDGVVLSSAPGNTVGGTRAAERNVISANGRYGVVIEDSLSTGNVVEGNYIGTDITGSGGSGNALSGVRIQLGASGNTIGGAVAGAGNVIADNSGPGVDIDTSDQNTVQGNFIGTNASGTAALGNSTAGVFVIDGNHNTIGGTTAAERNLISGNFGDGVFLGTFTSTAGVSTFNTVEGNDIGTDVTGTAAIANQGHGIHISSGTDNTLGGTAPGAGNLISGNMGSGMLIGTTLPTGNATRNMVLGNLIGTNASGTAALGNAGDGVTLTLAGSGNTVGDGTAGGRNILSGNLGYGVAITGTGASGNTLQGNYIGTDITGTAAIANQNGGVLATSSNNQIGGTQPGQGNVISGNWTTLRAPVAVSAGTVPSRSPRGISRRISTGSRRT